jgi:hypothetical protein
MPVRYTTYQELSGTITASSQFVILLAGCGRFGNGDAGYARDMRIVCLSKQLTEMVFAIG